MRAATKTAKTTKPVAKAPTPHLRNIAWYPWTKNLQEQAKELYERRLYDERSCNRCEYLPERHCDVCEECPAYQGHYKMWRKREVAGRKWIGLFSGNRKLLNTVTSKARLRDKRCKNPMSRPVRFTAELRGNQQEAVDTMVRKGYGLLEAPPRSGKTVMGIAVACDVGYKTLILANQTEFLNQFMETVLGNKTNGIPAFTNCKPDKCGIAKTEADFQKYDICLATYQTFLSVKGKALLAKIAPLFGTVIVDEAHKVAAKCFLTVVNRFPAAVRIGLTGTPERKDRRDVLTEYVIGPVVYQMEVEVMRPIVRIIETGAVLKSYKLWTYFERALVEHTERNRLILKHAVADIKAGRSLVIPVTRVHHAIALAKAINKMMGESVATHFIGSQSSAERKSIIEKARNGDIKCVVGIRSLVQLGINVPRWDTIYVVMPISNPPNFQQETSRVRTPMEGKPTPQIKHFIEDAPQSRGCFRTCVFQTYMPERFSIGPDDRKRIEQYVSRDKKVGASKKKASF